MKTENLPVELRTLIERFPNDRRVREMLTDAAAYIEQLKAGNEGLEATVNGVIEAIGGDWQDVDTLPEDVAKLVKAHKTQRTTEETPVKSANISDMWLSDVIAMLHYVAGDLSADNRLMALAAQSLIQSAPRLSCVADGVWHDWHGGERPVGFNDIVDVRFRDGTSSGNTVAGELVWHHDGQATDIVSWVLVERHHGTEN